MADRKDKINEQQAEQEIREEMKHADQEPAQEQYSLNDDRRVKVLSPGMLVAKRFIRNRMAVTGLVILVFMFVFSFIGGLISPYGQDQFFYTDKTIRRDFGAAKENTEFQYASNNDEVFGLTAQARAMLAIQQGKTTFSNKSDNFTLTKVSDDFYSVGRSCLKLFCFNSWWQTRCRWCPGRSSRQWWCQCPSRRPAQICRIFSGRLSRPPCSRAWAGRRR